MVGYNVSTEMQFEINLLIDDASRHCCENCKVELYYNLFSLTVITPESGIEF